MRSVPLKQMLLEQAPSFGVALVIAEFFYKFHSFTLECIAFLATWYVLNASMILLFRVLRKPSDRSR
jgi:hypothetical protein